MEMKNVAINGDIKDFNINLEEVFNGEFWGKRFSFRFIYEPIA
jgi:hypothetical protein